MTSTDPIPRQTRQRASIRAYLKSAVGFQTAQQIHDGLRGEGTVVSLPTVYRTLSSMVEAGEVDVLVLDEQAAYRCCSPQHHHHLVCRRCGCTIEVTATAVEQWAAALAQQYGFTEIDHLTEVTGVCPTCQSR